LLPIVFAILLVSGHAAFAWHDETHIAVAKAAGYAKWYNAAGPDMAKTKAGSIEGFNHFYDNPSNAEITPAVILEQIDRYNNPRHEEGHLYGAIVASLREYRNAVGLGKYAEYHLAFCAHYITDLSQPLHNIPYDDFNRQYHSANDGIVNKTVLENLDKIRKHMYEISLRPDRVEEDLTHEIARIANISRKFGYALKREERTMTEEEAFTQLGHSASLLKAVIRVLGK